MLQQSKSCHIVMYTFARFYDCHTPWTTCTQVALIENVYMCMCMHAVCHWSWVLFSARMSYSKQACCMGVCLISHVCVDKLKQESMTMSTYCTQNDNKSMAMQAGGWHTSFMRTQTNSVQWTGCVCTVVTTLPCSNNNHHITRVSSRPILTAINK